MSDIAIRAQILGVVQGVGYRAWARDTAEKLSLSGWARNMTDGAVEVVVIGAAQNVAVFLEACKSGPAYAEVSAIKAAEEADPRLAGGPVVGFRVLG